MKEEPAEFSEDLLGKRYKEISPYRKMLDIGLVVSGGSDGPVSYPDPIKGIFEACNHYVPE